MIFRSVMYVSSYEQTNKDIEKLLISYHAYCEGEYANCGTFEDALKANSSVAA
jgi:hypothetical protein